jgi:hypothetical protein
MGHSGEKKIERGRERKSEGYDDDDDEDDGDVAKP